MKNSNNRRKIKKLEISKKKKNPRTQSQIGLNSRVKDKIRKLYKLLREQDKKCWLIGDRCIDLLDNEGLSLGQIANLTNYSKTRISHFHLIQLSLVQYAYTA